jgi:hypothetical protein
MRRKKYNATGTAISMAKSPALALASASVAATSTINIAPFSPLSRSLATDKSQQPQQLGNSINNNRNSSSSSGISNYTYSPVPTDVLEDALLGLEEAVEDAFEAALDGLDHLFQAQFMDDILRQVP